LLVGPTAAYNNEPLASRHQPTTSPRQQTPLLQQQYRSLVRIAGRHSTAAMGMGSASASSTAKRFSSRSVAIASVAALLVVAGGTIAALDHKDGTSLLAHTGRLWKPSVNEAAPAQNTSYRGCSELTKEATSRHHGTHRRRPTGTGSEPLPRRRRP